MTAAILSIVIIAFLIIWGAMTVYFEKMTEKPSYKVLSKESGYEIRQYESYIRAKILVKGSYIPAVNRAFGPLVDYIYGNNVAPEGVDVPKDMRTPLFGGKGIYMHMAAPVRIESVSENESLVSFTMSKRYSETTLPKPKNPRIKIEVVPPKKIAAKRFGWYATWRRVEKYQMLIFKALEHDQKVIIGRPTLALYNPPFSAPYVNRAEILVEIE